MSINYEARTQAYVDVDKCFGTASVNLVDGNFSFNHTDWEFGNGPNSFALSHIYVGANYDKDQFATNMRTRAGYGWKTNFDQYLVNSSEGNHYIDSFGNKHTFVEIKTGVFCDDGGLGLTLSSVGNCKMVTDKVGNTMHFAPNGQLCRIDTIFKNSIFVGHNTDGSISKIEVGDNVANFLYDATTNNLSEITYSGTNEKLVFSYVQNKPNLLASITKQAIDSNNTIQTRTQVQFAYNTNNRLYQIYDDAYTALEVTYTNGKATTLATKQQSNTETLDFINIESNSQYAYTTNKKGIKTKYTLRHNGDIIKIEEVDSTNEVLCELYPDKNPNNRVKIYTCVDNIDLDTITALKNGSTTVLSFGQIPSSNALTVNDIYASLDSLAKRTDGKFDFYYNDTKNCLCNLVASSYSLHNNENKANFSASMLSEKTFVYDNGNNLVSETICSTTFASDKITTNTICNISGGSHNPVSHEESIVNYKGQTLQTIQHGQDNSHYIKTNYTYDEYGNTIQTDVETSYKNETTGLIDVINTTTQETYSLVGNDNYIHTDADNKETKYKIDQPHNVVSKITYPYGVTKEITYDLFKEQFKKATSKITVATSKNTNQEVTFENSLEYDSTGKYLSSAGSAVSTFLFGYNQNTGDLQTVSASGQSTPLLNLTFDTENNIATKKHATNPNIEEKTYYNNVDNVTKVSYNNTEATFAYQQKNNKDYSKAKLTQLVDGFAQRTTTFSTNDTDIVRFTVNENSSSSTKHERKFVKRNYQDNKNTILKYNFGTENTSHYKNITYNIENYNSLNYPNTKTIIKEDGSSNTFNFTINYTRDKLNRLKKVGYLLPYANQNEISSNNFVVEKINGSNILAITAQNSSFNNGDATRTYEYDERGNIAHIFLNDNGQFHTYYTYDKLNRIIREDNQKLGKTTVFFYDANGNISSKQTCDYKAKEYHPNISELPLGDPINYYYSNSWKDVLTGYGSQGNIVYSNNNGYPSNYRGKPMTWDRGNLTSTADNYYTYTYTYDVYGRRIKRKASHGEIRYYHYDDNRLVCEQRYASYSTTVQTQIDYLYDDTGICGCKIYSNTGNGIENKYYVATKDIMGNVVRLDGQEGCVMKITYDAFGCPDYAKTTSGEIIPMDIAGGSAAQEYFPFAFKGYYYDNTTELYYLMSRYYDPVVGRFISPDSIDYLEPQSLLGMNLYAYCNNNPVMYSDHSGHAPEWLSNLLVVGAGVLLIAGLAIATIVTGGAAAGVAGSIFAGALKGALIGAAVGTVAGGAIGYAIDGLDGMWTGMAIGFTGGAVIGALIGGSIGYSATKIHSIYISKTDDVVAYVGRTNNISRRTAEHALGKRGIVPQEVASKLTLRQARGLEQALINKYGMIKNGGTLLNKINSISINNPIYQKAVSWGIKYISKIAHLL